MHALRTTSCQVHCSCSSSGRVGRAGPSVLVPRSTRPSSTLPVTTATAIAACQPLLLPSASASTPHSHRTRGATRCSAAPSDPPAGTAAGAAADAAEDDASSADDSLPTVIVEDFDGLQAEEDAQVPGTYSDALNGNTRLGKAVRAACSELEHLNDMELQMLQQAEDLLKKLGVKQPLVVKQEQPEEPQA